MSIMTHYVGKTKVAVPVQEEKNGASLAAIAGSSAAPLDGDSAKNAVDVDAHRSPPVQPSDKDSITARLLKGTVPARRERDSSPGSDEPLLHSIPVVPGRTGNEG
jgi:hypothetical protein